MSRFLKLIAIHFATQRLCDFALTPNRLRETARNKFVFAPAYSDVTKPVYTKAVKRWEHYAEALEPVKGQLAKYCEAFGY